MYLFVDLMVSSASCAPDAGITEMCQWAWLTNYVLLSTPWSLEFEASSK